jgi:D-alanyl-D-alanine carboxypeptidase (penicillin-binding protein 5/6)
MSFHKTNTLQQVIRATMALFTFSVFSAAHAAEPAPPTLEAAAYILIDAATGKVLAENNADQKIPPASLTKMMSDYVVASELKRGSIHADDKVHISEKAWAMQGSKMFVEINADINLMDLVRGMIIQSGNDATIALAEHIAGSEDAFTDIMNQKAVELGMTHTSFKNASGWPDPDHYTTTRDLSILARAMVNQTPEQYAIYSEKEFSWHDIKQPNRNLLLWRDPSVDGIKTGHTEEAGFCLVASAKRGETRLISVVMGTKTEEARATESLKLLNFGFREFQTQQIYSAGKILQQAPVWSGALKQVDVGVKDAVVITIPRGTQDKLHAEVAINKIIQAPLQEGEILGSLTIQLDGKEILSQPVVAMVAIPEGGIFTRIWDGLRLFFLKLFGGI